LLIARGATTPFLLLALAAPASHAAPENEDPRAAALRAFQAGELEQASRLCREWLAAHPDDAATTHLLGMVQVTGAQRLEAQGRPEHGDVYARALDTLLRAESLAAGQPLSGLDFAVAHILIRDGRYADAELRLERALAGSPGNAALLARRGQLRLLLGRLDDAAEDLSSAVEAAPLDFNSRVLYGEVLFRTGRAEDARLTLWEFHELCESGRAESPNRWRVLSDVATYAGDDLEEARRALEEARRLEPEWVQGRARLGAVYYRLGEMESARTELERALDSPDLPREAAREALEYAGLLALQDGDLSAAQLSFERALSLGPRQARLLRHLGLTLRRLGDEAGAKRALAELEARVGLENDVRRLRNRVFSSPEEPSHRVGLIRALVELGDRDAARGELERLRRLAPGHPGLERLAALVDGAG
jgi:tetratricopeptide (TPR) repeat protein